MSTAMAAPSCAPITTAPSTGCRGSARDKAPICGRQPTFAKAAPDPAPEIVPAARSGPPASRPSATGRACRRAAAGCGGGRPARRRSRPAGRLQGGLQGWPAEPESRSEHRRGRRSDGPGAGRLEGADAAGDDKIAPGRGRRGQRRRGHQIRSRDESPGRFRRCTSRPPVTRMPPTPRPAPPGLSPPVCRSGSSRSVAAESRCRSFLPARSIPPARPARADCRSPRGVPRRVSPSVRQGLTPATVSNRRALGKTRTPPIRVFLLTKAVGVFQGSRGPS